MWFKIKKEKLEQTVFDVTYKELCPICKVTVQEERHLYKNPYKEKTFLECPTCHIVLMGKQVKLVESLQTFERDKKEEPLGLKKINEEVIRELISH